MSYEDIYLHNAQTGAELDVNNVRGLAVLVCSGVTVNCDYKVLSTGGGLWDTYTRPEFRARALSRRGNAAAVYRGRVSSGSHAEDEISRLWDAETVVNREWDQVCGNFALVDDGSSEGARWIPIFVNRLSPVDAAGFGSTVRFWARRRAAIAQASASERFFLARDRHG